jgi:hypothetical protein
LLQNGKQDLPSGCEDYCSSKGRSEEYPSQPVLQINHFEIHIDSLYTKTDYKRERVLIATTKLPYNNWVNWDENLLGEVKEE